MKTKQYVVGLMFNDDLTKVALIRKLKPEWQRGKLNGIGGSVEAGELFVEAMMREFQEETGKFVNADAWSQFCHMFGGNNDDAGRFEIMFYGTQGDLLQLKTVEKEPIVIEFVSDIKTHRVDIIENLDWLVALAVDHLKDGRPKMVECQYP